MGCSRDDTIVAQRVAFMSIFGLHRVPEAYLLSRLHEWIHQDKRPTSADLDAMHRFLTPLFDDLYNRGSISINGVLLLSHMKGLDE